MNCQGRIKFPLKKRDNILLEKSDKNWKKLTICNTWECEKFVKWLMLDVLENELSSLTPPSSLIANLLWISAVNYKGVILWTKTQRIAKETLVKTLRENIMIAIISLTINYAWRIAWHSTHSTAFIWKYKFFLSTLVLHYA